MIAADMISYVKRDMVAFGSAVLVIVLAMLTLFFRRLRWVALPVMGSGLAVLLTVGWLGFVDRPATVVSANFIAVLAIVNWQTPEQPSATPALVADLEPPIDLNLEAAMLTAPLEEELEALQSDLKKAEEKVRRDIGL